jgi:predicted SnoaL-like aldol condensation-catalyzing enzyme
MTQQSNLALWHSYIEGGSDRNVLAAMLADDAVFHSPVVHTPQAGKALVMAYLGAAGSVFGNGSFRYVREIADGANVMLEFEAEMDGIHVNGVDIIGFTDDGKIKDFKVMVRPLKAVNKVWEMMAAQLQAAKG